MKKYLFATVYTVLLALFTLYTVLDTFVWRNETADTIQTLPKTFNDIKPTMTLSPTLVIAPTLTPTGELKPDPAETGTTEYTPTPTPTFTPTPTPTIAPTWSEDGYVDSNVSVKISKYRDYESDIYVVDVIVNSADLLKTQIDRVCGDTWEYVSDISKACGDGLILSINGDCYGRAGAGYSIKNGVVLSDKIATYTKVVKRSEPDQEDIVLFSDGSAKIIREGDYTAEELVEMGAWQLFSFGPALIKDGKDVSGTSVTAIGSDVVKNSNPRTAIGLIDDLHYLFIIVDGRNKGVNRGVTCSELAQIGMNLGAKYLYNLDGGGSSTLYFNGEVINRPCRHEGQYGEVTVTDIVYIGY